MVFSWGKKAHEPQESRTIHLDDILNIINDIQSAQEKISLNLSKSALSVIKKNLKTVKDLGDSLDKANFDEDDSDRHLHTLVTRGKKQVVDTIQRDTTIQLPDINNFDDVLVLDKIISKSMKHLGYVLGRQTRIIHIFAKRHANKLKVTLSEISKSCSDVASVISTHKNLHLTIDQIKESMTSVHELSQELSNTASKMNTANKNALNYTDEIQSVKEKISQIKDTSQYADYTNAQKQLVDINAVRNRLKGEINSQFTKISRPLAKFTADSVFDDSQKRMYVKLVDDPIQILIPENTNSVIILLQIVRKGVESGSVSVKDVPKSLTQIDATTEMLASFSSKVLNVNIEIEKITNLVDESCPVDLAPAISELKSLELDYQHLQDRLVTMKQERYNLQEQYDKTFISIGTYLNKISPINYTLEHSSK